MIRRVPAYVDSEGVFHPTREAACKAEFRRLIEAHFQGRMLSMPASEGTAWMGVTGPVLSLDDLVEALFDLDRIVGEAQKEDTRMEYAPALEEKP